MKKNEITYAQEEPPQENIGLFLPFQVISKYEVCSGFSFKNDKERKNVEPFALYKQSILLEAL